MDHKKSMTEHEQKVRAKAQQLIDEGWYQVSNRLCRVARLPKGKTGIEALAEDNGQVWWAESLGERAAGNQWLQVYAVKNKGCCKNVSQEVFDAFRHLGGRTYRAQEIDAKSRDPRQTSSETQTVEESKKEELNPPPQERPDWYVEARTIQNRFEHGRRRWKHDHTCGDGTICVDFRWLYEAIDAYRTRSIEQHDCVRELRGFNIIQIWAELLHQSLIEQHLLLLQPDSWRIPAALVTALFEEQEAFDKAKMRLRHTQRQAIEESTGQADAQASDKLIDYKTTSSDVRVEGDAVVSTMTTTFKLEPCGKCGAPATHGKRWAHCSSAAGPACGFMTACIDWPDDHDPREHTLEENKLKWNEIQHEIVPLDPCTRCGTEATRGNFWPYCSSCHPLGGTSDWPADHRLPYHTFVENAFKWNTIQQELRAAKKPELELCGKCGAVPTEGNMWPYCPTCRQLTRSSDWPWYPTSEHSRQKNNEYWNKVQRELRATEESKLEPCAKCDSAAHTQQNGFIFCPGCGNGWKGWVGSSTRTNWNKHQQEQRAAKTAA